MILAPEGLYYHDGANGSRGLTGVVPGNATLVFEVQLLNVGE
jgi:FKBP-type peptidyl-prolyl cis-trans isomerase